VAGEEVVAELVRELEASAEAAAGFEGEMQELAATAQCVPTSPTPGPSPPLLAESRHTTIAPSGPRPPLMSHS